MCLQVLNSWTWEPGFRVFFTKQQIRAILAQVLDKMGCFKILLTPLVFVLQIHPTVWEKIQQGGSRAVYQTIVWVGDNSKAGDQHDARICTPSDQPVKVSKDFCWQWKLCLRTVDLLLNVAPFMWQSSYRLLICPAKCWWLKGSLVQTPFKALGVGLKVEECQFSLIRKTKQLREPRIKAESLLRRRWKLAHDLIIFISLSHEKSWQCHLYWRLPEANLVLPGLPAVCAKLGAGMGVFPCAACPCQCWILKCLVFCFLLGKRNCFPGMT